MAALKAPEVYQGGDWLTWRPTVAKAFDTLDHIEDICQPRPAFGPAANANEVAALFNEIADLGDDLVGDLDAVLADVFPYARADAMHRWLGFEMQLHVNSLRVLACEERDMESPSIGACEEILALSGRIRTLLKQIDQ
jgi:hypothetical protein